MSIPYVENDQGDVMVCSGMGNGVLSQATKNKTYTLKNICSSASKDRSHRKYLT